MTESKPRLKLKVAIPHPRFVMVIGAIREEYPDIPEDVAYLSDGGFVIWDRQEREPVVTVHGRYGQLICLEHKDHDTPFSRLEKWLNELDNEALEDEGIPPTVK